MSLVITLVRRYWLCYVELRRGLLSLRSLFPSKTDVLYICHMTAGSVEPSEEGNTNARTAVVCSSVHWGHWSKDGWRSFGLARSSSLLYTHTSFEKSFRFFSERTGGGASAGCSARCPDEHAGQVNVQRRPGGEEEDRRCR